MTENQLLKASRYISFLLRHDPGDAGLTMDMHGGWVDAEGLIRALGRKYAGFDRAVLEEIVRTDEKGRYSFSPDGTRIHANQGHSLPVDMGFAEVMPPESLYHGTATRFLDSIFAEGLKPMSRQYVHLTPQYDTALDSGSRHGKGIVLTVKAGDMFRAGCRFYLSENGVYLTEAVPPAFLALPEKTD